MREFVKELGDDATKVEPRFAAASTISSMLAPIALVLGLATILGYEPVRESMILMGLPRWSVPVFGAFEIAAAFALIFPVAAFFGAATMTIVSALGAVLYLRLGEIGFALVLGGVAALFAIDVFVRAPELFKTTARRLWSPAKA